VATARLAIWASLVTERPTAIAPGSRNWIEGLKI
jgi:hypothetical protein